MRTGALHGLAVSYVFVLFEEAGHKGGSEKGLLTSTPHV